VEKQKGYWKWMYEGTKFIGDWFWNDMRIIVYYFIFAGIYWCLVALFDSPLSVSHYIPYYLLIWFILSILLVSYVAYKEENPSKR